MRGPLDPCSWMRSQGYVECTVCVDGWEDAKCPNGVAYLCRACGGTCWIDTRSAWERAWEQWCDTGTVEQEEVW